MKNKRVIIISIIVVLLGLIGFGIFYFLNNEDEATSLSLLDKQWIENNKKNIVDLSIFTDVSTVSDKGNGLIFDFLNSLERDTTLTFNTIAYKVDESPKTDYAFKRVDKMGQNQLLLYRDNEILISKKDITYSRLSDVKNIKIGVLKTSKERVSKYLSICEGIRLEEFDSINELIGELSNESSTIDAIILPRLESFKDIFASNLYISYNLTDLTDDYVLALGNNERLNQIITKYFEKWKSNNIDNLYNKYFSDNILNYLEIPEKDKSDFKGKRYTYGFVEVEPYDITIDGKLMGINKSVLENFSTTFGVEFIYKKYSNYNELVNAFNNKEIDIFFDVYKTDTYEIDNIELNSMFNEKAIVLTNKVINIDSIYSLIGEQVITVQNSKLSKELEDLGINVKTYKNVEEVIKKANSMDIIVIDNESYNYYVSKNSLKFKNVYTYNMNSNYYYRVNNSNENKIFIKVFDNYLKSTQTHSLVITGYNDLVNIKMMPIIIKYISIALASLISICLIFLLVLKIKHSVSSTDKAFTKEDKLRYIDMLTSLKNRNYLNDNLEKWDNSEIYPQAIIIVDLNNIAYINDNYGHEEGDKVIGEAANILIRNQMSNTEVIRTSGNEFLIYLVSYDEKQVVSYIKKLNKEFKELSHKFGASLGYSMINDGIKTVDDAINEATLDMRSNKEELN
ncbi:MAG: GGDEF domain-containing protein [Clostridium sp.]|nr:GGDEF domain-containing protein [Clostridium sp.]MCM1444113.1 GGDEF domain-containing protein [Candidatus Amulumruptor caecigallinarius]